MAKINLTDVSAGYLSLSTYNANNTALEAAIENTLSRDGTTPNTMSAALDMNSQRIENLPTAVNSSEPVTLGQAATIAGVTNPLTQAGVGAVLYPATDEENAASVTPTTLSYPPGDVRRYGTVGDGATDDATALQKAVDSTDGADYPLVFQANTSYSIGTRLLTAGNTRWVGNGATLIPDDGVAGISVYPGADTSTTTLSADAQIHTNTITVTSAANMAKGVLIKLTSDAAWYLDPAERTPAGTTENMVKGEVHVIKAVSGTTITLEDTLSDNYDAVGVETVTVTVLPSCQFWLDNLQIKYAAPGLSVGVTLDHVVNSEVKNLTIDGAQTTGVNMTECYNVSVHRPNISRANRVSFGYGIQLVGANHCRVTNGHFLNCRRGVDCSGVYPSRYNVVDGNHIDGSGLQSDAGENFDDASGYGGHETSEHNIFSHNYITHVQTGAILRGANEVVDSNYFYGDIKNSCVLSNKASNFTVKNNTYAANLRPYKVLDVVASDDDEQKAPWFIKIVDPDTGFVVIKDNICDDLKNSFCVFSMTSGATGPTDTIISNNIAKISGSTATTTVNFLESNGVAFTMTSPHLVGNRIDSGSATLVNYHADITLTNPIENYYANDVLIGGGSSYGEMAISANATATTVTVSDTWYQVVAGWATGGVKGVTFNTDELVSTNGGTYMVTCAFSFTGATNDTFSFALAKNDTVEANTLIERKTSTTDVGAAVVTGIVTLAATDTITFWGKNQADTDNFVVTEATLTVVEI